MPYGLGDNSGTYGETGVLDRRLTVTFDATLLRAAKLDDQGGVGCR